MSMLDCTLCRLFWAPIVVVVYGCAPGELVSTPGTPSALVFQPGGGAAGDNEGRRPVDDEVSVIEPDRVEYGEPEPPSVHPIIPQQDTIESDSTEPQMEPEPEPSPVEPGADPNAVESCNFGYPMVSSLTLHSTDAERAVRAAPSAGVSRIAYPEPLPGYTWQMAGDRATHLKPAYGVNSLTMPGYDDEMPLFNRGAEWRTERRCYELPTGARMLTQDEAYELWARLVSETLWYELDRTPGKRTVIGLRGAFPGRFESHGNTPNWFDDTLVLMWIDEDGNKHVREFPVNTDTGARDFGYHQSSSLKPNRYYPYTNGWHRSYNALRMDLASYPVRDDSNKNGHWDDDRNGWLDGGAADHDRLGSGHNIHMGSVEGSLSEIRVNRWSAGCQVIPGSDNWIEFIRHAWTDFGNRVDYYLVDARDIAASVWQPCEESDGTYRCPHQISQFPYRAAGNTAVSQVSTHNVYNCSDANEGGKEVVYVLNIRESARLDITISTRSDDIDPDIHLLTGNDSQACLARGHRVINQRVAPGRYLLVVDTWVNDDGVALEGAYDLSVTVQP
ncbi:MAG: hypothetical protein VYA30_11635 [Myxococcota bacterium]|nr:hypothetical protein [Myxococcota bacterium]